MTWYSVYVGSLDDPDFKWDGGDPNGNIPHPITLEFPNPWRDFWMVLKRIEDGVYEGKQVDWGGWVAKINKQQLKELVDDICASRTIDSGGELERLEQLRTGIEQLSPSRQYALVACES